MQKNVTKKRNYSGVAVAFATLIVLFAMAAAGPMTAPPELPPIPVLKVTTNKPVDEQPETAVTGQKLYIEAHYRAKRSLRRMRE